jgi:tetratricopeptide (TPR) repeat protein
MDVAALRTAVPQTSEAGAVTRSRMIRPFTIIVAGAMTLPFLFAQTQDPAQEAQRANELVRSGKLDEGISIYDRLVRSFPNNPGLLLNLCIAEFKASRYLDALEHARGALKLKPDLAPADLFLGRQLSRAPPGGKRRRPAP